MDITFKKHILRFKQPAGTSRGIYRTRTVWYITATDTQGNWGIGECAPLPDLSCDAMPDGMSHEFHFTYDAKGRIINQKGWNDGVGDIEYKYKYTQEDAKGNWTEREKSIIPDGEEPVVTIEKREIEYY